MVKMGQSFALPAGQAVLDDRALIVNHGAVERLYGRWDVLFGAWERAEGDETWREAIPQSSVLLATGAWRPNVLLRPAMSKEEHGPPDMVSTASHEAYFSLIPAPVRRLAAPFSRCQWLMMDMMWMVPEFCNVLDAGSESSCFEKMTAKIVGNRMKLEWREGRCAFAIDIID